MEEVDDMKMVGRIKVKFTEDLKKLWSCETARLKYPHKIGDRPRFCGKMIEVKQIPKPRGVICSSTRFWRPLGGEAVAEAYEDDLAESWVCDHFLDVGD